MATMKLKRSVFQAWRVQVLSLHNEALRAENKRISDREDRRADSTWTMKREELNEVARRELGMSGSELKAETVITLREKLRVARVGSKQAEDPRTAIPPGLDRMKVSQLVEECVKRDLAHMEGSKIKTRGQMIVLIRDDVRSRSTPSARMTKPTQTSGSMNRSTSQTKRRQPGQQMEWEATPGDQGL